MTEKKDIRWKQRFQNFEKAVIELDKAIFINEYTVLERAGLIQLFEVAFELGWKTLKDFLEEKGQIVKFPRDVIKESFAADMIKDGHAWIDMLEKRNMLSHTYDEVAAKEAVRMIKEDFFPTIKQVYELLKSQTQQ